MKITILLAFIIFMVSGNIVAQVPFNNPESVMYDAARGRYLISNAGSGNIHQIDSDGDTTMFSYQQFTRSLGMAILDDILYVATNLGVSKFDLTTDQYITSIFVYGMNTTNDVAADNSGYIWVTDSGSDKIFRIRISDNSSVTVMDGSIDWPNGILYQASYDRILFCAFGIDIPIRAIDPYDFSISVVRPTPFDDIDGLAEDNEGNIYISTWGSSAIYRYSDDFSGSATLISSGHNSPADIYYDKVNETLCIPNFDGQSVDFFSFNDVDGDDLLDYLDNCPNEYNPDQADNDYDGNGNPCDLCPGFDDYADSDQDGVADGCDLCPGHDDSIDDDADEVIDGCDNCEGVYNPDQEDPDYDGLGSACDNCPHHYNPWQEDYDGDNIGNICDFICGDFDSDTYINILDIVNLINYLYKSGPPPSPLDKVDVNHDFAVNILDIVFLINYIYKSGPIPECPYQS